MKFSRLERKRGQEAARRLLPVLGMCEDCGRPAEHRHHDDRNCLNNHPSNIVPLCAECHTNRHMSDPEFVHDLMRNLEKAHANSRWRDHTPTKARSGDPCPKCGRGMTIKATHYRRDGSRWSTIGCRPVRGGCGYIAGAYPDGRCRKGGA